MPFTIKKVLIYGTLKCPTTFCPKRNWEGVNFEVEIWDKDRAVLFKKTCPVLEFDEHPTATWVGIAVPDIEVNGKFYVHFDRGLSWIHIGADDSVANEYCTGTDRRPDGTFKRWDSWPYGVGDKKSKMNWMIRVVGTAMIPEE